MLLNFYFKDTISNFLSKTTAEIIGQITLENQFDSMVSQNKAWEQQISILRIGLEGFEGTILFEFSIPRMGKRVDALVIIKNIVFVIEFKVGESKYLKHHLEQVWDYALDLKHFHRTSHDSFLIPVLVATESAESFLEITQTSHMDKLTKPTRVNGSGLALLIEHALHTSGNDSSIDVDWYLNGSYSPTPTIIEAALSLYNNHTVEQITRSDADATNLNTTSTSVLKLIEDARLKNKKAICFVTGVPGAGKTLVGLKIATSHLDHEGANKSVYLSGNAPLVAILQEALARNKVQQEANAGNKISKKEAKQAVKSFIQIIHH